jgi:phosphoserine phosphatase RsbU/P
MLDYEIAPGATLELEEEVRRLRQELQVVNDEKADLEILLETTMVHATEIENELCEKREQEQKYLRALRREMEVGRRIQANFLPENLPKLPGWEIDARFKPSRDVAGDFYDVFRLPGNDQLGLVIADVCDKGVGAALFMALTRSLLRVLSLQASARLAYNSPVPGAKLMLDLPPAKPGESPLSIPAGIFEVLYSARLANDYIAMTHSRVGMFSTLFFAVLEANTGDLYYVNGGHVPPVVLSAEGVRTRLTLTGPAIGMIPGINLAIRHIRLEEDDYLVALTDGVTEAHGVGTELFGEERLVNFLREQVAITRPTAAGLLDSIELAVQQHVAGAVPSDDITTLAVRRLVSNL